MNHKISLSFTAISATMKNYQWRSAYFPMTWPSTASSLLLASELSLCASPPICRSLSFADSLWWNISQVWLDWTLIWSLGHQIISSLLFSLVVRIPHNHLDYRQWWTQSLGYLSHHSPLQDIGLTSRDHWTDWPCPSSTWAPCWRQHSVTMRMELA